jgi:hypothetical protein
LSVRSVRADSLLRTGSFANGPMEVSEGAIKSPGVRSSGEEYDPGS